MISRDSIKNGYSIKPLGELVEFLDSQRRPITQKDRVPGPYPYYGANGQQDSVADFIFDEPLILLAEDGGYFDDPNRGIAYAIKGKAWVNNHAHVLRPRDCVRLDFLTRVLQNYDIAPWINGSTRAKLTKAAASRIEIPLPPLFEQKRIAGILDAADALRAKRREALDQLGSLLQSTFLCMFGDPVTNPKGWEIARLSDVVQRLDGGKNVSQSETPTEYRVLKVSAVTYGVYRPDESKYLPADFAVPESYIVKSGDLLISRANTVELIGATAYVWETPENMVLPDKIWKFIWKKGAKIEPLYVYHLTRDKEFRRILGSRASGTSGSMKNIAKPKLLSLPIPLPPIDLQREFAAIVESVERQKTRMRNHLAELDALFASLQSRAFSGTL